MIKKILHLTKEGYKRIKKSESPDAEVKALLNPEIIYEYGYYGISRLFMDNDEYFVEIILGERREDARKYKRPDK